MDFILIYLLIVNAAGFFSMLLDKLYAKKKLWRIPEATLLGIAVFGGSIGAIAGMYLFRHKTKHWYFRYGFPIITVIEACVIFLYYYKR
mgnify:CR=1 FL=1